MAAFWAVFTFGGSGPALTAHGSLDPKQEIQIQIQTQVAISQCCICECEGFRAHTRIMHYKKYSNKLTK
jgi:hypothetical protein